MPPRIFHLELGKGPVVLLIHGYCETHVVWKDLGTKLSENFRVIIPDLPGFGNSDSLPTPFSMETVAETLWKKLDSLAVNDLVVIGHSLGGYVALAMAAIYHKRIRGLGLFHSTALPDSAEKKENRNKVIDFVGRNGVGPFMDTFVPGLYGNQDHPSMIAVDRLCRQTPAETVMAYAAAMRDRPDRQAILMNAGFPILILAGEKDKLIAPETLEKQAKMCRNGQLIVLKETGHMGMFEAPTDSINAISRFAKTCQSPNLF